MIIAFLAGMFFTWISWFVFRCHFGHLVLSKLTKGEMFEFALCVFKWRRIKAQVQQPQNPFSWRRGKNLDGNAVSDAI